MVTPMTFAYPKPVRTLQSEGWHNTTVCGTEKVYYDPKDDSYKTESQERKIKELENELSEKEKKRKKDLQGIVGYFYKRGQRKKNLSNNL